MKQVVEILNRKTFLRLKNNQLKLYDSLEDTEYASVPIEDIEVLILSNRESVYSHQILVYLSEKNIPVIFCDNKFNPVSTISSICGNSLAAQRTKLQIKNSSINTVLWRKTIKAKVYGQGYTLKHIGSSIDLGKKYYSFETDPSVIEAQSARKYWNILFDDFKRDRYGNEPNSLLNFGYAILRSIISRIIIGKGLNPIFGINHSNYYNHLQLSDDIIEPYRFLIDIIVKRLENKGLLSINKESKKEIILFISNIRIQFDGSKIDISTAIKYTVQSLLCSYESGDHKKFIIVNGVSAGKIIL